MPPISIVRNAEASSGRSAWISLYRRKGQSAILIYNAESSGTSTTPRCNAGNHGLTWDDFTSFKRPLPIRSLPSSTARKALYEIYTATVSAGTVRCSLESLRSALRQGILRRGNKSRRDLVDKEEGERGRLKNHYRGVLCVPPCNEFPPPPSSPFNLGPKVCRSRLANTLAADNEDDYRI